ncbi:MAG: transporter substrate-binding domain-containing protein [Alphaproteobacteria bacterium]|nr:transporter substrate-binding domain-containing protein [Alphaproteobacteria bacterium]
MALAAVSGVHAQGARAQANSQETVQPGTDKAPPLRLLTIEREPFAMVSGGKATGFSIELWQEIAAELGISHRIEFARSFPEMLTEVAQGRADVAIANITITAEREQTLDFSQPMFDAGLQVMAAADGGSGGLIGAIFNWEMLGLVVLAGLLLLVVANLMWWFERRDQAYFQYPYKEGLWRSFWWALNMMVNGGFEERVPQTRRGRVFAVFLVIASLFLVSAFVAKITAALTVGELKSQIQSYRDLFNRRVGTTEGSTSAAFLERHGVPYRKFATMPALLEAMAGGELDAVVHDAPVLAYYVNTKGNGRVRLIGAVLRPEKYGIALPPGSAAREGIDRALLRIREDGRYDELYRKWFGARP